MNTSNITGPQLLIKYIDGDITPDEIVLLNECMKESPELKRMFEKLSDKDNLWDRFFYQHEIDSNEAWEDFKSEHFVDNLPDNGSQTKSKNYEQTQDASIQMNWDKTFLIAVAIVLAVGTVTYAVVNVIGNRATEVAEVQSQRNVFVPGPVAKFVAGGYWDLDDKGRYTLEDTLREKIDLPGSSILYQGEMFTIKTNDVEEIKPRIIRLVTAGKQIKVQLPDGSRVKLNKNSSIIFSLPFDSKQRTVGLWGEAYFEVESNPEVPFVVQLNNKVKVQAYGTVFTVSSSETACYTTLLRGHVTVTNDEQTKTLTEGEQVQITAGDRPFKVTPADPEKAIAWTRKNGFDYRNIGFKQMMQEIGGWFDHSVVFIGDMPQKSYDIKITEEDDMDFLLKAIEKKDNIKIKIIDKKIIINSKTSEDLSSGFKFQAAPFKP